MAKTTLAQKVADARSKGQDYTVRLANGEKITYGANGGITRVHDSNSVQKTTQNNVATVGVMEKKNINGVAATMPIMQRLQKTGNTNTNTIATTITDTDTQLRNRVTDVYAKTLHTYVNNNNNNTAKSPDVDVVVNLDTGEILKPLGRTNTNEIETTPKVVRTTVIGTTDTRPIRFENAESVTIPGVTDTRPVKMEEVCITTPGITDTRPTSIGDEECIITTPAITGTLPYRFTDTDNNTDTAQTTTWCFGETATNTDTNMCVNINTNTVDTNTCNGVNANAVQGSKNTEIVAWDTAVIQQHIAKLKESISDMENAENSLKHIQECVNNCWAGSAAKTYNTEMCIDLNDFKTFTANVGVLTSALSTVQEIFADCETTVTQSMTTLDAQLDTLQGGY